MARIRNKSVYSEDKDYLQRLYEELRFLGREKFAVLDLRAGSLTQLVYPPRKPKKSKKEESKTPRNKHAESAARHS
jgi:hypothetical protein